MATSSLLDAYSQQFGVLTAEITNKLGRIPKLTGDEKSALCSATEKQLEECLELMEQMELEARDQPAPLRVRATAQTRSLRTELSSLEADYKRSRIAYSDELSVREKLLSSDGKTSSHGQRSLLLGNTERLESASSHLEAGYRTVVETEQIGQDILDNLHRDRETIQRARERLRETDSHLGKSSRVLSGMMRR
ncbi:vesicle transport through interaction with t-SNAREs homolog 1A isoform X3 [Petromyzon marinus]